MSTQTEKRIGINRNQKQGVEYKYDRPHKIEEQAGIHAASICDNERQQKHGQTQNAVEKRIHVERTLALDGES